jgi:hypothetical protein
MAQVVTKVRGDDWSFPFTWRVKGGAGVDLTGYTVGADFYRAYNATPVEMVEGSGVTVLDREAGKFEVTVASEVTASVTPQRSQTPEIATRLHVYVVTPGGNRETLGVIPVRVVAP